MLAPCAGARSQVRGGYNSDRMCSVEHNSACQCGAAGTTFFSDFMDSGTILIVDNGGLVTTAATCVLPAVHTSHGPLVCTECITDGSCRV
jgi:hypothetical protein